MRPRRTAHEGGDAPLAPPAPRSPVRRLILLVAVVVAATVVVLLVPLPDIDRIRGLVDQAGYWGPVAFVLGYAALTLAPVPKSVLSIAAGVLFGFWTGMALVYAAALLGAAAGFWLGRVLGRDAVERLTRASIERVDAMLRSRGFVSVVGLRLVPVLPFTVINYAAGLTSVRWWPYFLGTMVGILPGTTSYLALGAYGFHLGRPAQVGIAVLGVLTLAGVIVAVRARHTAGHHV